MATFSLQLVNDETGAAVTLPGISEDNARLAMGFLQRNMGLFIAAKGARDAVRGISDMLGAIETMKKPTKRGRR